MFEYLTPSDAVYLDFIKLYGWSFEAKNDYSLCTVRDLYLTNKHTSGDLILVIQNGTDSIFGRYTIYRVANGVNVQLFDGYIDTFEEFIVLMKMLRINNNNNSKL